MRLQKFVLVSAISLLTALPMAAMAEGEGEFNSAPVASMPGVGSAPHDVLRSWDASIIENIFQTKEGILVEFRSGRTLIIPTEAFNTIIFKDKDGTSVPFTKALTEY